MIEPVPLLPDDFRVCNCADCGRLLASWDEFARFASVELVDHGDVLDAALAVFRLLEVVRPISGRIAGRPYCDGCLDWRDGDAVRELPELDGEPLFDWDAAVRTLEELA